MAARRCADDARAMQENRDALHELLSDATDTKLNGHAVNRLPNTLNLSFAGSSAVKMIAALKDQVAFSAGSGSH